MISTRKDGSVKRSKQRYCLLPLLFIVTACAPYIEGTKPNVTYSNIQGAESLQGIGIDSHEIVIMTDKMMKEILLDPLFSQNTRPPRVIIDSEYFINESSSRINKNMITDRLRIELNRAANGRILFIGRHFRDMVEEERKMKREGNADAGSLEMTKKVAGADFRLGGRIMTQDNVNPATGTSSRYHQITFEMVDLETGFIVWSGMYEFKKTGQDDSIYR